MVHDPFMFVIDMEPVPQETAALALPLPSRPKMITLAQPSAESQPDEVRHSGNSDSVARDSPSGVPANWESVATSIIDYPSESGPCGTQYIVNPWSLMHRKGVTKIMMCGLTRFQPALDLDGWSNPLWALALQTAWQNETGRHLRPPGGSLDPGSWWAAGNHSLTVLPFLVAVDVGFVSIPSRTRVVLARAPEGAHTHKVYFTTMDECVAAFPKSVPLWKDFFQAVKASAPLARKTCLRLLWLAHDQTILEFVPMIMDKLEAFPLRERKYALGWATLVRFLAEVNFDTSFTTTVEFASILPGRVLTDSDQLLVAEFPGSSNRALLTIELVRLFDVLRPGALLWIFASLSEEQKEEAFAAGKAFLFGVRDMEDMCTITHGLGAALTGLSRLPFGNGLNGSQFDTGASTVEAEKLIRALSGLSQVAGLTMPSGDVKASTIKPEGLIRTLTGLSHVTGLTMPSSGGNEVEELIRTLTGLLAELPMPSGDGNSDGDIQAASAQGMGELSFKLTTHMYSSAVPHAHRSAGRPTCTHTRVRCSMATICFCCRRNGRRLDEVQT